MVYLSKIYTKTGDQGETSLGDGTRVPKNHARVTAYGAVDELNAVLGVMLSQSAAFITECALLRDIQNDLFDVGADLCLPESLEKGSSTGPLRVQAKQAERLEAAIDRLNARLSPLKSFVIPGGSMEAAWCHLARTVCRRAEREIVTLSQREPVNPQVVIYLNRLSDLLFVLARIYNNEGKAEVLWQPGKTMG